MNSFRHAGHRSNYTNETSTAVESGDVVVLGTEIGIAVTDIAVDALGTLERCGVHSLDALTAGEWDDGDQLYWDATNLQLTNIAAAHVEAGKAWGAKVALSTTAEVLVNGRPNQ